MEVMRLEDWNYCYLSGMMERTEIEKFSYPSDIAPRITATHSAIHRVYLKLGTDMLSVLRAIGNFYNGEWERIGQ